MRAVAELCDAASAIECVVEDTDGHEALAPAPHEHRWITDDDGCVHACVCGAPWEPAAPALGPPPREWVNRAIADLGLDFSTMSAVNNLLYGRKRDAGMDHRAAYDVPNTVGELVACRVEDLRRGRNIGPKKIAKVQAALAKHGMQLARQGRRESEGPMTRKQAEMVFDEMSARQLAEIVRVIARDRGVQAAAVTITVDEDRNSIRLVVCAPCATSEETFGVLVAKTVAEEFKRAAAEDKP